MPKKKSDFNKSEFIRSMPNAKPAEIVAAAKAKGEKLSAGLVYVVRSASKSKGKAKTSKAAPKGKAGRKPKSAAIGGELHTAIRKLAWIYGFVAVEAATKAIKSEAGL